MTTSRDRLIAELLRTATPVTRPGRTLHYVLLWIALTTLLAVVGMVLRAPITVFRWPRLFDSPQFLLDAVLGLSAIVALSVAAFRAGIPSAARIERLVVVPMVLLVTWIALQLYGLVEPALPPSMDGKRVFCWLEIFVTGLPGLALGCYALRRLWPLHGVWTGALLGLASGGIPALTMQFICMYESVHILQQHVLPALALGLVGGLIGVWLVRPR